MLEGKLELTVGKEVLVLHPGDSLYFDPTVPHASKALGRKTARFLSIFVQDPTS